MRGGPPRLCSVVGQHRISTLQTIDGQLAKQNAAASLIGRTDEETRTSSVRHDVHL